MTPYVLIVEDETAISTLLEYNLQQEGFETGLAGDGDLALLMAEERTPDLILLDWMIPKLSGVEVCRRLRRREATANVPIIMLSARSEEDDRVTGLDIGADDYLVNHLGPTEFACWNISCAAPVKSSRENNCSTRFGAMMCMSKPEPWMFILAVCAKPSNWKTAPTPSAPSDLRVMPCAPKDNEPLARLAILRVRAYGARNVQW